MEVDVPAASQLANFSTPAAFRGQEPLDSHSAAFANVIWQFANSRVTKVRENDTRAACYLPLSLAMLTVSRLCSLFLSLSVALILSRKFFK